MNDIDLSINNSEKEIIERSSSESVYENGWTEQGEQICNKWHKKAVNKAKVHELAAMNYAKYSSRIGVPIVVLGTSATFLSSYNIGNQSDNNVISIVSAVLTGLATVCASLKEFVRYGEKSEQHFASCNLFNNLARTIQIQLYLPVEQRKDISVAYEEFSKDFNSIEQASPILPESLRV